MKAKMILIGMLFFIISCGSQEKTEKSSSVSEKNSDVQIREGTLKQTKLDVFEEVEPDEVHEILETYSVDATQTKTQGNTNDMGAPNNVSLEEEPEDITAEIPVATNAKTLTDDPSINGGKVNDSQDEGFDALASQAIRASFDGMDDEEAQTGAQSLTNLLISVRSGDSIEAAGAANKLFAFVMANKEAFNGNANTLTEDQTGADGVLVDALNDIAAILADALALDLPGVIMGAIDLVATLAGGALDIVDVIL